MQRMPGCVAAPSIAVQLAACQVLKLYEANGNTRHTLRGSDVIKKLVDLTNRRHPLTAAPAVQCVGIICDLGSDNADAVIRACGVQALLCTLEEDCPAQVRLMCTTHW